MSLNSPREEIRTWNTFFETSRGWPGGVHAANSSSLLKLLRRALHGERSLQLLDQAPCKEGRNDPAVSDLESKIQY